MQAEIITIGDELLIGQVVDTNSAWLGRTLGEDGIKVTQITSIQDDADQISRTVNEALARVSIVLVTGGLGPTRDDITKHTLAKENISLEWWTFNRDAEYFTEVFGMELMLVRGGDRHVQ